MALPIHLLGENTCALTKDTRLVAIRWDVLDWGVVLDLDVPITEEKNAAMRRAWLAFSGVSEITIAMKEARLPNGIGLTSSMDVLTDDEGFHVYSCQALLPVFDGNVLAPLGATSKLIIRALDVSRASDIPGEYGLSFESRQRLCSDENMMSAMSGVEAK